MPSATPLRSLDPPVHDGLRTLSDPGLAYADGAEGRLAEIVGAAADLSSSSRELADAATDWATTYSLDPGRANLLRPLDLGSETAVLEIGCGCGPLTRYLGERCGTVDSVEPMAARARVAQLRTRDLDAVRVHVGTLEDVPREPAYDVVVVVGVLEYVGNGTADPAPYVDFLARCHDVLREGGTLVLAIENALGVKYLAGAGEDHTNRPFDSLEDYALASPARTFTRETLADLVSRAGLAPTVLGAFPDYKMPRVLMAEDLFRTSPALAERLPRFPSPDWVVPRLPVADEGLLWRSLVSAGVGPACVNSFVVLATKGAARSALWPQDRLAAMYTGGRQPQFDVRTEVVAAAGAVELRRSLVHPDHAGVGDHRDVRHRPPAVEEEQEGQELLRVVVEHPERRGELLRAWADAVPDGDWLPVDLVPHNVLVRPDGTLAVVDQEWEVRGYDRDALLLRGLLWAAVRIAGITRPERGGVPRSVRDLVEELAGDIGLPVTEGLLDRSLDQEAAFQAAVNTSDPDEDDRRRRARQDLLDTLGQDLLTVRGGPRLDELRERDLAELSRLADLVAAREAELAEQRERVEELEATVAAVHARLDASVDERLRRRAGSLLRRLGVRAPL